MNLRDFKNQILKKNPVELLIGVFILLYFLSFLFYSFRIFKFSWVALPYQSSQFLSHPWTIITYSFFHARFVSLIFNLILLFYFGNIFLSFENPKKFWKVFVSGILLGGLFFLLSYKAFPHFYIQKGALLGASAGIMAVITYISLKLPNYPLQIRFIGRFKLVYIFLFFLLFNLLQIPLGNPGGYFAHIGGVLAGLICFGLDKIKKKSPKSVLKEETGKNYKVNKILEKINSSGYESLTEEEKEYLFRHGK